MQEKNFLKKKFFKNNKKNILSFLNASFFFYIIKAQKKYEFNNLFEVTLKSRKSQ